MLIAITILFVWNVALTFFYIALCNQMDDKETKFTSILRETAKENKKK